MSVLPVVHELHHPEQLNTTAHALFGRTYRSLDDTEAAQVWTAIITAKDTMLSAPRTSIHLPDDATEEELAELADEQRALRNEAVQ